MKPTKPPLTPTAGDDALIEEDRAERQLALEYIADAWNVAEDDGVEQNAPISLFAAITRMVRTYEEQAAADLIVALPTASVGRINLDRSVSSRTAWLIRGDVPSSRTWPAAAPRERIGLPIAGVSTRPAT